MISHSGLDSPRGGTAWSERVRWRMWGVGMWKVTFS